MQNCTENIPSFLMRLSILQNQKPPYTFLSLPVNDAQKEWQKKETIEWVLVVFACKRWPKKNCKIWQSTYLWAQKVPTTSQQSSINLALCVVSMVWEKEIEEEHFYCFQPWWQVLTHVYHSGFFVDCCGLHLWHWMEWSISCSYQVLYLVPSCLTLLPGMIPMFGTRYQEYHQIVGPRSSILYLTTPLLWVSGTRYSKLVYLE